MGIVVLGTIIGIFIHHLFHRNYRVTYFSFLGVFREWGICIIIGWIISAILLGAI